MTPAAKAERAEREVVLETGSLSESALEVMLNTLPVEINVVDAEDTICYVNQSRQRIFPRTKSVIGQKVQLCHPTEVRPLVDCMLQDFRNGRRDVAEFWKETRGLFLHTRYFALRDAEGGYLGTLEVAQDVSRIRSLEDEQRMVSDESG